MDGQQNGIERSSGCPEDLSSYCRPEPPPVERFAEHGRKHGDDRILDHKRHHGQHECFPKADRRTDHLVHDEYEVKESGYIDDEKRQHSEGCRLPEPLVIPRTETGDECCRDISDDKAE